MNTYYDRLVKALAFDGPLEECPTAIITHIEPANDRHDPALCLSCNCVLFEHGFAAIPITWMTSHSKFWSHL